ncbi:MAG TPA: Ger(x)C family spore germination C-terminal domain-containing protein, partial [Candidatus Sulfotelmatobacter sp.]|nr:Ger(x)C family spore germination C-terminal domain-containing protein [Candidatus Sulfotelmatobacter sp.]
VVSAPCPDEPERKIAVRITRAERRIRPIWDGRQLSFQVQLEAHARVLEMQCHIVIETPDQLDVVEDSVRKELTTKVIRLVHRLQAAEADPFGFGERVRAKLPAVWQQAGNERWFKTWAKTPVHVESIIGLVHLNMSTEPPSMKVDPSKD